MSDSLVENIKGWVVGGDCSADGMLNQCADEVKHTDEVAGALAVFLVNTPEGHEIQVRTAGLSEKEMKIALIGALEILIKG